MIKLTVSINSQILLRPVSIFCVLPYSLTLSYKSCRVIWSLHCAMEDGSFFIDKLGLINLVDKCNVALVAPSLGNGYFINSSYERQGDFLQLELMPVLRELFSLPPSREDNFLLGISMGGFGAAHWALSSPESFKAVALISGIFDASLPVDERAKKSREQRPLAKLFSERVMPLLIHDNNGDVFPDVDIKLLFEAAKQGQTPKFALWYGDEDYLSKVQSCNFIQDCRNHNIEVIDFHSRGGHNLGYWQEVVYEAVAWLIDTQPR